MEELELMDKEELEVWEEWVVLATRGQPPLPILTLMAKVVHILHIKHIFIPILVGFRGPQALEAEMAQPSQLVERTRRMEITNI